MDKFHFFDKWDDEKYLKFLYKLKTGKKLNLSNPTLLNEKMQWLKLNDRKDIYCQMVDKFEVKKIVSEKIGKDYIIPTFGVWENFEEIDFSKLPEKFIIKCTHDSGGNVICHSKLSFDIEKARKKINKAMKKNYFFIGREWPYKDVKPRIIVEQLLEDCEQTEIIDYKFFCFNGIPQVMYISKGMDNHDTAQMSFFDMNYNLLDLKRSDYKILEQIPEKPKNFDKMIEFSKLLSVNIPHVRCDWYEINGRLYFGELTFFTCSGYIPFEDEKWNKKMGNMLKLDN